MAKHRAPPSALLDEAVLNALSEAVAPRPPAPERKAAMRARIMSQIDPPLPEGLITYRAQEMRWRPAFPGVDIKILRRDIENNNQTALWRLAPGAVIPGHPHNIEEECLVLDGEIAIGEHIAKQGDMHIAKPGFVHPDLVSEHGALLLVRSEIPVKHPA